MLWALQKLFTMILLNMHEMQMRYRADRQAGGLSCNVGGFPCIFKSLSALKF